MVRTCGPSMTYVPPWRPSERGKKGHLCWCRHGPRRWIGFALGPVPVAVPRRWRGRPRGLPSCSWGAGRLFAGQRGRPGGVCGAPLNNPHRKRGSPASPPGAPASLGYTGAGENRPAYMEVLVDEAARVLAALHTHAQIEFRLLDLAEFYYPIAPGSKAFGRLVTCAPFPATTLGVWRDKVRLSPFYHSLAHALPGPNPALGESAGPQVGHSGPLRHQDAALEPWRQRSDWPALAARLHEDEAHRVAGAALVGYLFRAVLQRGITVRTACEVESLLVDQGRVVGLTLTHQEAVEHIRATHGVVLATSSGD